MHRPRELGAQVRVGEVRKASAITRWRDQGSQRLLRLDGAPPAVRRSERLSPNASKTGRGTSDERPGNERQFSIVCTCGFFSRRAPTTS